MVRNVVAFGIGHSQGNGRLYRTSVIFRLGTDNPHSVLFRFPKGYESTDEVLRKCWKPKFPLLGPLSRWYENSDADRFVSIISFEPFP